MIGSSASVVIARLRRLASRSKVESQFDGIYFLLAIAMAAILAWLAVRAAVRLEFHWDTVGYHLPFAAVRGGIDLPFEFNEYYRAHFEGFPPLPQFVEGLLWRLTGDIHATNIVNFAAFLVLLVFCRVTLKAPFWLVALIALTAPMVLIHVTIGYVDLFSNVWLAIALAALAKMYFDSSWDDSGPFLWAMAGLTLAAWSKFQTVPMVAAIFVALFAAHGFATGRPAQWRRLWIIGACALVAAAPYLKNLYVYGNPFWPLQFPLFGDLFPYSVGVKSIVEENRPGNLAQASQASLFFRSLLEIGVPTSYEHRPRWIHDAGNAWVAGDNAHRMGGYWGLSVAIFLLSLAAMAISLNRRRGVLIVAGIVAVLALVAWLPQSHELRYFLFLPLSWAALIGMLYPQFKRRFPHFALALLVVWLGLFTYMFAVNQPYYQIERRGYAEAAKSWGADRWWPFLEKGKKYCVIGMEPIGMLMTGPTMSEYRIVNRRREENCPADARIVK